MDQHKYNTVLATYCWALPSYLSTGKFNSWKGGLRGHKDRIFKLNAGLAKTFDR